MKFPDRLATNFELVKQLPSNKPFDVFLVKDKTKDLRPAVLRILPDSLSGDKPAVDAFMGYFSKFSEIINRAYIPTVYSVSGQAGGNVYVLEECVSGIDLTTFIKSKRNTPGFNKEIISIAGKVCEALHHAHQKDLFHLAITSEDILIDETTGRVKLVGFGVQIFAQLNKMGILSAQASKTIAPQVLTGAPLRPRADVYSLAKVMNDVCPEVFSGSDVLSMALLENPEDRYQQARDFEGALNNVLEDIKKAARSKNIDTVAESKGGLKPVLTKKPVTVERDVYQPPPRTPHTHEPQPQIKPDSVPVMPELETPKSISMKLVAAIVAGVLALVIGLAVYVSHEKQSLEKEHEITAQKDAQKIAAMEKDQIEKERQAAIEKERLQKELEASRIKEAARVAAIEKEKRDKDEEIAKFKEAQRLADLYKERIEKEKLEKELELERIKKEQQELPAFAWNYPDDVKNLLRRAIKGDSSAQGFLAWKYYKGEGVPKDDKEAVKWFIKAADQGNDKAQNMLGVMYAEGRGVTKDYTEAAKWYRNAAEQGNPVAQSNLASRYANGQGVPKDDYEAIKWYRKSAEQGEAAGQAGLGMMYAAGRGVSKDDSEAVVWFRKSADQGNASGQSSLGVMCRDGRGVSKDDSEAVKWFRKSAEQGNASGQSQLGEMYRDGRGVSKDDSEAVKWFRKSADQGNASGESNLGFMYELGRGVGKDYSEAVRWYKKAAEQGNATGQSNLGVMYRDGRGVNKDESEAVKWFRKSAEQGNAYGQANLGNMYLAGRGVQKDRSEAINWLRKAEAQDHQWAKDKLRELGVSP
jgi:TPR repeat protein